jgi:hypothetical protein
MSKNEIKCQVENAKYIPPGGLQLNKEGGGSTWSKV